MVRVDQDEGVVPEAVPDKYGQAKVRRLGRVFGLRPPSDDPAEKQNQRGVECVLFINTPGLLIFSVL